MTASRTTAHWIRSDPAIQQIRARLRTPDPAPRATATMSASVAATEVHGWSPLNLRDARRATCASTPRVKSHVVDKLHPTCISTNAANAGTACGQRGAPPRAATCRRRDHRRGERLRARRRDAGGEVAGRAAEVRPRGACAWSWGPSAVSTSHLHPSPPPARALRRWRIAICARPRTFGRNPRRQKPPTFVPMLFASRRVRATLSRATGARASSPLRL